MATLLFVVMIDFARDFDSYDFVKDLIMDIVLDYVHGFVFFYFKICHFIIQFYIGFFLYIDNFVYFLLMDLL